MQVRVLAHLEADEQQAGQNGYNADDFDFFRPDHRFTLILVEADRKNQHTHHYRV